MKEIIESYVNGNYNQMVEQIKEYGPFEFTNDLTYDFSVSEMVKVEILSVFIRKTC